MSLIVAAGMFLGVAGLSGTLWPLAWVGAALFAALAARSRSRVTGAGALAAAAIISNGIWLHWSLAMAAAMLPSSAGPASHATYAIGFVAITTLPAIAAFAVAHTLFFGRPWVRYWFPLAWLAGETAQSLLTGIPMDWLFTQVDVPPVMSALGRFGMWPTTLACLFVAASAGEAVARRHLRLALPALVVAVASLQVPSPAADSSALEGVGAVHMRSFDTPPVLDAPLELLVWPEGAFAARPPLDEGDVEDATLDQPLGPAAHLAGFTTLLHQGQQNSVLAISAAGRIEGVRAKRLLMPVFERAFLGIGHDEFVPGRGAPILAAGGRKVIPLLCGELLSSSLAAEGKRSGGELIAIAASDAYQGGSDVAYRQVLAHVRLRARELSLPAVYASLGGRASIVSAEGDVLGESERGVASGVLRYEHGVLSDRRQHEKASVAVIYSSDTPWLRPDCPPGRCAYFPIEDFVCTGAHHATVIVAGHADPPSYLGQSAARIAEAVGCFAPELVVIDSCYGASTAMLVALADRTDAVVVAPPFLVAGRGLRYGGAIFGDAPVHVRAAAVRAGLSQTLFVGRPNKTALLEAERALSSLAPDVARARVRSWSPPLAVIDLGNAEVVAPIDWRPIRVPPAIFR